MQRSRSFFGTDYPGLCATFMIMPIDASLVTLREITSETVIPVIRLSVAESQKGFVAPNSVSLAQALFAPGAWYRAIYFSDELVGFVMLEDESLRSPPLEKPNVFLWRFMIDSKFQGRGIGRAALLRVLEHVRDKGLFQTLETSYVPGPGCPEPFYTGLGFRHTGRVDEDEIVLELPLKERRPNTSIEEIEELAPACGLRAPHLKRCAAE